MQHEPKNWNHSYLIELFHKLQVVRRMKKGCLLITELNNLLLMIVCIPCSGIHSRAGQRLNGERMIRPAGEWKSTARILGKRMVALFNYRRFTALE